jgi:chemotaxis protein MotB
MFASGRAVLLDRARLLVQKVAQVAARLPHGLSVAGHTDAAPFRGGNSERGNWELSADRANAVRRMLLEGGVAEARLHSVAGHADRTPLLPAEPFAAANRRVSVTLLRQAPSPAAAPETAPVMLAPVGFGAAATPAPRRASAPASPETAPR